MNLDKPSLVGKLTHNFENNSAFSVVYNGNIEVKPFSFAKKHQEFEKFQLVQSLLSNIKIVVDKYIPSLLKLIEEISKEKDPRTIHHYKMSDIIFSAILMFNLYSSSRNDFNNNVNQEFKNNIMKLFGVDTPHLDTVFKLITQIPYYAFAELKNRIIEILFDKKFFNKAKRLGLIYVAIDGTRLYSFDEKHCDHCLTQTSKNGVVTYHHDVLEAKIVFDGNLCFSIATEFIENEDPNAKKQDCEINAGKRLMDRLKKMYPKLKLCILGDALYASSTIINKCIQHGWKYIITFKETDLKQLEEDFKSSKKKRLIIKEKKSKTTTEYYFNNNGSYSVRVDNKSLIVKTNVLKYTLYNEQKTIEKFAYITNIYINRSNCNLLTEYGRERFAIENDGFNNQKNKFNITHKFFRKNYLGMKNIYEILQVSHIILNLSLIIYNLKSKIIKKITLIHIISRVRELIRSSEKDTISDIITKVSKIGRVKFT